MATTPTSKAGTWVKTKSSALRAGRRGFTLLELLAVLLVIGIILGLTLPRISSLTQANLRTQARLLSGSIRLTYNLAVMNKKNFRIAFDLDQQSYQIEVRVENEYVPVTSEILKPRTLPDGVWIRQVSIADRACDHDCRKEYLYFSPYGYVEEAAIYLTNDDETQAYTLLTQPVTGKVLIQDGHVGLPDPNHRH
jgi:prepilin-type N-terminal cleavage/methylation domain-containing protein